MKTRELKGSLGGGGTHSPRYQLCIRSWSRVVCRFNMMIVVPSNGNAGVVRREQKQRTIILNLGQRTAMLTGGAAQDIGAASDRHRPAPASIRAAGLHPRKQSSTSARAVFTSPPRRRLHEVLAALSRLSNYATLTARPGRAKNTRCRARWRWIRSAHGERASTVQPILLQDTQRRTHRMSLHTSPPVAPLRGYGHVVKGRPLRDGHAFRDPA
jgi:hypothetical protein